MDHTVTDRGFKHMTPVEGTYPNNQVRVYESSSAEGAHVWLRVRDNENESAAHLTLEQAETIARQLSWLVAHHYQVQS